MEQAQMDEIIKDFRSAPLEQVVELLNPANAKTLPEQALALFEHLSDEQIAALAKAYPNGSQGNVYLILKDTKVGVKQLFPRSTWENLYNLRVGAGMKNYVAMTFSARFQGSQKNTLATLSYAAPQDLSKEEVIGLPGLKTSETQTSQPILTENDGAGPQGSQGGAETGGLDNSAQTGSDGADGQNSEVTFPELKVPGVNEQTGAQEVGNTSTGTTQEVENQQQNTNTTQDTNTGNRRTRSRN